MTHNTGNLLEYRSVTTEGFWRAPLRVFSFWGQTVETKIMTVDLFAILCGLMAVSAMEGKIVDLLLLFLM